MSIAERARIKQPVDYRWALEPGGRPVPIELAQRGEEYFCPLCHSPMIARLGNQLQHHYGHEYFTNCPPEAVTRAAMRRWIALLLTEARAAERPIPLGWDCVHCGEKHTLNLLHGVATIEENSEVRGHLVDVVLRDGLGELLALIFVQDEIAPTADTLALFAAPNLFVIAAPASYMPQTPDLRGLLTHAQIISGPCANWNRTEGIVRDPDEIRRLLVEAVRRPPEYFCGPVQTHNGLADMLRLGSHVLWLPEERWENIVGGTRNPLSGDVNVLIQQWPQPDGSMLYLYYVTIRETRAVALRRYPRGINPQIQVDARFRMRRTTALDLARHLVTH